jgi:hypothetical protein
VSVLSPPEVDRIRGAINLLREIHVKDKGEKRY